MKRYGRDLNLNTCHRFTLGARGVRATVLILYFGETEARRQCDRNRGDTKALQAP
jgi:hypothetical protein